MGSTGSSTRRILGGGDTAHGVAERCRRAGLSFINGGGSWTKADLGLWLVGAYRDATHSGSVPPSPHHRAGHRSIEPAAVDDLLADAHVRVLTVLENLSISRTKTSFAHRLLAAHAMIEVTDASGATGWMPVAAPRMRLAYRVLTLFAADALTRPEDYEWLTVCHRCEHVRFRHQDKDCVCTRASQR